MLNFTETEDTFVDRRTFETGFKNVRTAHIWVHIIVHNWQAYTTQQSSSDYVPSYVPHKHQSSDAVYWRGGDPLIMTSVVKVRYRGRSLWQAGGRSKPQSHRAGLSLVMIKCCYSSTSHELSFYDRVKTYTSFTVRYLYKFTCCIYWFKNNTI